MNKLPADKNRRVLVIDDNRAIHDDFRKILSPAITTRRALEASEAALFGDPETVVHQTQFELDSAYQGEEGVLRVQEALEAGLPYAMAFVDVRMPPGWDGIETTRKLWELDPSLQVVLCTAYSDYSWGEMFEKLGQRDGLLILKKPFDAVEAFQLAHALTEKWWLHQQSRRKIEELESRVVERTADLQRSNHALQTEVAEHKQAELALQESEARTRLLVKSSGIGLWDWNLVTDEVFFSLEWKSQIGYADAELPSRFEEWESRLHPEDREATLAAVQDYRQGGSADYEVEFRLRHKDGSWRWILARANLSREATSPPVRMMGCHIDITERKQAENALRESNKKFHQLADNITDAFWIRSPNMLELHYISPAFERIWGRSVESLYANPQQWADFILPEDRERVLSAFAALTEAVPGLDIEYRIVRPDGEIRWVRVRSFQVRDAADKLVRHTGIVTDITDRQRAAEELRESERRFSDTLRNLALASVMLDRNARITWCNDYLLRLTGWQREEAIGGDWFELFLPPEIHKELRRVHSALLDDQPAAWHYENEIVTRSGERRVIRWNNSVLRSASGEVIGTASIGEDITERKQAEAALQSSEARTKAIVQSSLDCIIAMDHEGKILEFNPAAEKAFGYARAEVLGRELAQVLIPPALRERHRQGMMHYLATGEAKVIGKRIEITALRSDGSEFPVELAITSTGAETPPTFTGFIRDISERKLLEAQLFQSQKMETVGKLAGGVAHEFNSIMTAIIGQSELLLADLPSGNPLAKNATEIHKAADRAATLTRQLLAYGRKQILQPEILDLNRVIVSMDAMLRQLLGSDVDLRVLPAAGLLPVKADAGQIEQVIMNLAVNSRDAMPQGGKLTLETSNVTLDHESVGSYPDLKPGAYVMLAITDTGTGMSPEVKARLFEPFFTTKGVGRGTGLGLATCYGILKQSGGNITAYSEPGRGTTFKIYLPHAQVELNAPRPLPPPDLPHGTETILLVEDDPALREMASMLLGRLGYSVEAANGSIALSIVEQQGQKSIDLLFTDVVMPEMNGKELSDRIASLHPDMRILFASAYTENAIVHQGFLSPGVALLQKPFTPSRLAAKIREVLDSKHRS